MQNVQEIIAALDAVQGVQEEDELDRLGEAVDAVPACDRPAEAIDALLRVFERFPLDDGFESFWSILHTLERLPSYPPRLITSVCRRPSLFSTLMVMRMLNADIGNVDGYDLLDLLRTTAARPNAPPEVRHDVQDFLDDYARRRQA